MFTSGFCYSLDTFLKAVHLFRLDNALFLCYTLLRDLAEAGHKGSTMGTDIHGYQSLLGLLSLQSA